MSGIDSIRLGQCAKFVPLKLGSADQIIWSGKSRNGRPQHQPTNSRLDLDAKNALNAKHAALSRRQVSQPIDT